MYIVLASSSVSDIFRPAAASVHASSSRLGKAFRHITTRNQHTWEQLFRKEETYAEHHSPLLFICIGEATLLEIGGHVAS